MEVSNCCQARIICSDICSDCKEHCEPICEDCGELICICDSIIN
jgi:hypothetical protein